MTYPFSSADGAVFSCTLDFWQDGYANLDFFDESGVDVPLHLSFRHEDQALVRNRLIAGKWRAEHWTPLPLPRSGSRVSVSFAAGKAQVRIDGTDIVRYNLAPRLGRRAATLHSVAIHGGARSPSILQAGGVEIIPGQLHPVSPLRLQGWGVDPDAPVHHHAIVLAGTSEPLPCHSFSAPEIAGEHATGTDEIGVLGVLPGWIWEHADPQTNAVRLDLLVNGKACADTLEITRHHVIEDIEKMCAESWNADPADLICAIEHARDPDIAAALSGWANEVLRNTAKRYGLSRFLGVQTPYVAKTLAPIERAFKDLSARLAGAITPVVERADFPDLSDEDWRTLLFASTAGFCHADRFESLFEQVVAVGLPDLDLASGHSSLSITLPYLFRTGRQNDLYRAFRSLLDHDGWIDIDALSWTILRVIRSEPGTFDASIRAGILDLFLALLGKMAEDHFSQGQAPALVRAAAEMLHDSTAMSEGQRARIATQAIALYEQCPAFWSALDTAPHTETSPARDDLAAARARFDRFREGVMAGKAETALAALPATSAEAGRLRRELTAAARLGGMSPEAALDLVDISPDAESRVQDDAVLRHIMLPGIDDVPSDLSDDLVVRAHEALRRSSPHVPEDDSARLRAEIGELARELLGAAPTEENLDAFFARAEALATWRYDFVGMGLALSLLHGAQLTGNPGLARAITGRLEVRLAALGPDVADILSASVAVRSALWSLRASPSAEQSTPAEGVFRTLEPMLNTLPPAPARDALLRQSTPFAGFHDVIVVVCSCRPHLSTRLPAMRAAWLDDLSALGIPYIVAVGDAEPGTEGQLIGDTVHLDAPDDYDGLPDKILSAIDWVHANTSYAHIFKVDDDCFVNVSKMFGELAYKRYAYFGRRIPRHVGSMDRAWHHNRAGAPARDLDKSPEPSDYADGGGGYFLERSAQHALLETARSWDGARLRSLSLMEDKMVGDLLRMSGVPLSARDYHTCILRRNLPGGRPVGRWENGVLPSRATPTLLGHLDDVTALPGAAALCRTSVVRPRRLWPTYFCARLGADNLNVELVSPDTQLSRVNAAKICVVGCLRNERMMLPMFLDHYRKLGVEGFLLIDNCSDDGTLEYLLDQPDVATFSADTRYDLTQYGVAWQQAVLANLRAGRWSLVADADEFIVLPAGFASLDALMSSQDFANADGARIFMLDLYPGGPLGDAVLSGQDPFALLDHCDAEPFRATWMRGPYGDAETWTSALRHRLLPESRHELFVAQKVALLRYRPWMRVTEGLHYATGVQMAPRDLVFAHFKYHAGFHDRVVEESQRGVHFNGGEEYRAYKDMLDKGREHALRPRHLRSLARVRLGEGQDWLTAAKG